MEKKISKKKIAISIIAVALFVAVIASSIVYAWYSSTLRNTGNKIRAGGGVSLALSQLQWDDDEDDYAWVDISDDEDPVFDDVDGLLPGDTTDLIELKLENTGLIDADFYIIIESQGTLVDGAIDLAEVLEVYVDGNCIEDGDNEAIMLSDIIEEEIEILIDTLDAGDDIEFSIQLKLAEDADDDYQFASTSLFDIVIYGDPVV